MMSTNTQWWSRKRGPGPDVSRTEELAPLVSGGINDADADEYDEHDAHADADARPSEWRNPRDQTPWQVLQTAECWLLFWSTWVTLGAYGIVALNLAQVCEANGKKSAVAFCVTLTMVAAASGRIGTAPAFVSAKRWAGYLTASARSCTHHEACSSPPLWLLHADQCFAS